MNFDQKAKNSFSKTVKLSLSLMESVLLDDGDDSNVGDDDTEADAHNVDADADHDDNDDGAADDAGDDADDDDDADADVGDDDVDNDHCFPRFFYLFPRQEF